MQLNLEGFSNLSVDSQVSFSHEALQSHLRVVMKMTLRQII